MLNKNKIAILTIILLIVLFSVIIYFLTPPKENILEVSGRLEGYETDISAKYGGIVTYIVAREGTKVHKGELIAQLEDSELQARLKGVNANIEISKQQAKQAKLQINIAENQLSQGNLNIAQSKEELSSSLSQAQASLALSKTQLSQVQKQLLQANSNLELAEFNYKRYKILQEQSAIPKHVYEEAKNSYDIARSDINIKELAVDVAKSRIEEAEALLSQANSTRFNPQIKIKQNNLLNTQLLQSKSALEAANANILKAESDKEALLAEIEYSRIKSPIEAIIISRTSEPGEIAAAGKTLLTLLNLNTVYMRCYVPEENIGTIRVGQKAKVYLDSAPKAALKATVSEIDITASFTPENIYFKNDRVKQVFGIKLNITSPEGYAKPGMPADAVILLEDERQKK